MRRRGDDRPRPSKPKPQPAADGAVPSPQCCLCGFIFTEEVVERGVKYFTRLDGSGFVCQESKACRLRRLNIILGRELEGRGDLPADWLFKDLTDALPAEWLFTKYPRDRTREEMDVRPTDWKATGWTPRSVIERRVLACILYHSWCYPVCLPYAVQLSGTCPRIGRVDVTEDEILLDQYNRPVPLRIRDIGRILNEEANVGRAIARLKATKEISLDEDHVITPAAKLLALTIEERTALYAQQITAIAPELKAVPKRYRPLLEMIREHDEESLSSDIFRNVGLQCTSFNDKLRTLRTDRDAAIESECSRSPTLLPELEKLAERRRRHLRTPKEETAGQQSRGPEKGDADEEPVEYLPTEPEQQQQPETLAEAYAAGHGKGALAKLPRPRPEPETSATWPETAAAVRTYIVTDDAGIAEMARKCREIQDCSDAEIAAAVRSKGSLATTKKNPMGFLLTAVPNLFKGDGFTQIRRVVQQIVADVERVRVLTATQAAGANQEAEERNARWARLKEHPEECERCKGTGRDKQLHVCNCPSGEKLLKKPKASATSG